MGRTHARDADVLEGEILDYYEEHRPDFEREKPEVRVRHIVVKDRNTLNQVWERLQKGELFEPVAREVSIDESAIDGGDLGYFVEDMVDPVFWSACKAAKLGRRTRTSTDLGHHIIEVMDRREAGSMRDLVDVRGEIQQRILAERRQEQRAKLLAEIKERVAWSVDLGKLE
jgi:parvulin-like peptidyl-prolyl isomerase